MPFPRRSVAMAVAALFVGYLAINIGSAANAPAEALEGHTVFVSISNMSGVDGREGFAAAVAVLVRHQDTPIAGRMPGVLWFNDQYLVDPDIKTGNRWTRYPCTGVVIAVERGEPDPRSESGALLGDARYDESYHITDPNDRAWDIDRWNISYENGSYFAWTVALGNQGATSTLYDDGGASCDPVMDMGCPLPLEQSACYQEQPFYEGELETPDDPADPCLPPKCGTLRYNALLFFWLADLKEYGTPVNHTTPGPSDGSVPGCHEDDPEFGCPNGDDDLEGNSHLVFDPFAAGTIEPGSADCTDDGKKRNDPHCHQTATIDIYYGTAPVPLLREYVIYDGEGRFESIGCTELSAALGICLP